MTDTAVYKVDGMDCGGCVKAVTRSITSMIPGTEVSVALEDGLVTVTGQAMESQVEEAVRIAGFEFGGKQG